MTREIEGRLRPEARRRIICRCLTDIVGLNPKSIYVSASREPNFAKSCKRFLECSAFLARRLGFMRLCGVTRAIKDWGRSPKIEVKRKACRYRRTPAPDCAAPPGCLTLCGSDNYRLRAMNSPNSCIKAQPPQLRHETAHHTLIPASR
jgi:hypothetical protein